MGLPAVQTDTGPAPQHCVIWLHGLGADGSDFAPIVPQLVSPAWPPVRFIFPHAPIRPVTINGGMQMRAWYDITNADLLSQQDESGMRQSIAEVETLLADERKRGIDPARILLAGFSQGGAIALAAGLRYADPLAGIIALSTYLPLSTSLAVERSRANADIPIFWANGSFDPLMSISCRADSRHALQSLGYKVDWHTYAMLHTVCPQEIHDLQGWMTKRLVG